MPEYTSATRSSRTRLTLNWDQLLSPFARESGASHSDRRFPEENGAFPVSVSREFPRRRRASLKIDAAAYLTSSSVRRGENRAWSGTHLHAVGRDDLPGETARQLDAEPRFSGPGGAQDHQNWHARHHYLVTIDHRERGTEAHAPCFAHERPARMIPPRTRGGTAVRGPRATFSNTEKQEWRRRRRFPQGSRPCCVRRIVVADLELSYELHF